MSEPPRIPPGDYNVKLVAVSPYGMATLKITNGPYRKQKLFVPLVQLVPAKVRVEEHTDDNDNVSISIEAIR